MIPPDDFSEIKPSLLHDALPYQTTYHAPVLCETVVELLVTNPNGVYIDGTLGGGGHSAALLDRLGNDARVIGIDQDEAALQEATQRLAGDTRFKAVYGNFADMKTLLLDLGIEQVSGILLDLGVSSHQLDEKARGFSFQATADLDMRMDRTQPLKASDVVNEWDEMALLRVLWDFGEEPRARGIVRKILAQRPIENTEQLATIIRQSVKPTEAHKALARVFQAIRIVVNNELSVLEQTLLDSLQLLENGGRIAVLSYHSLEDRRVKRFLKFGNWEGKAEKDFYGNWLTPFRLMTNKAIEADADEVARNPRARSAKLRVAERKISSNSQPITHNP